MKKSVKTWKVINIKIERVVEETTTGALTENKTIYYLIHARQPHGSAIGFRANTPMDCWSKLMQEVYL